MANAGDNFGEILGMAGGKQGIDRGKSGNLGPHDIGGLEEEFGAIDRTEKVFHLWEMQTHGILVVLVREGFLTTDELRRGVESLPGHADMSYYHRWAASMTAICVERGTFTSEMWRKEMEVEEKEEESSTDPGFYVGQKVRVRREDSRIRWRRPHLRTPGYLFGALGEITCFVGVFPDPERQAFFNPNSDAVPKRPLYIVTFAASALWAGGQVPGPEHDVTAEVYQPWLEAIDTQGVVEADVNVELDLHLDSGGSLDHGDHVHDQRLEVEQEAVNREEAEEDPAGKQCAETLRRLLEEKEVVSANSLARAVEQLDSSGRMLKGQQLVARAWIDKDFKTRLLCDGNSAAAELGIEGSNSNAPTKLVVVANNTNEHHLVVCTLCSCYPLSLLGMAPAWYKSRSYRARAVREPRAVLREFGLNLPGEKKIIVHDSTADVRYLVLPERPEKTEGLNERELASLVTRDSMIGVVTL